METREEISGRYAFRLHRLICRYDRAGRAEMLGALLDACRRLEPFYLDPDSRSEDLLED